MASDPSNVEVEEPTTAVASPLPVKEQNGSDHVQVKVDEPSEDGGEVKPEQQPQLPSRDARDTPTPEPEPKPQSVCGICKGNTPKYKYPEPKPVVKQEPEAPQNNNASAEPFDPSNPFRALETSEALKTLFRKYPNLPSQLLDIHSATLPPKEAPEKAIPASLMQGVTKRDNWNHDMGIKNGKAALRRARKANGEAGEAIREYTELIVHIMSGASRKEDAATVYIQRQAAEEDTKLIERLMAEEQRKR
ncbi:hypothetical protein PT974_00381 [Cladobotryum mycophilum]|uniref:Uncharacterized protein n=1 Tax=Cladobotryum mycophilum TaxID=491253 RepID=A0ABR0T1H1_9HYPO